MLWGGRGTNKSSTYIFIPYSKHRVFSITFLIMIYGTAKVVLNGHVILS